MILILLIYITFIVTDYTRLFSLYSFLCHIYCDIKPMTRLFLLLEDNLGQSSLLLFKEMLNEYNCLCNDT